MPTQIPPQHILFDVGGVLVAPLDRVAVRARRDELARAHGFADGWTMWQRFYTGPEWQAAKTGAMTRGEMWRRLLTPLGLTTDAARASFMGALFAGEGVDPALRRIVGRLHGRYPLSILSNADDSLETTLAAVDLARYFDPIVNSHRIGVAKPDVAAFEATLTALDAAPEDVFFIDDQRRNTRTAEALGLATHHYRGATGLAEALAGRGLLAGH